MTGPGDEMVAGTAGPGRLRASHADRDQAIEVLKDAFVQGRLTKDEFDARAGQALTARTCAEVAVLTADLPAAPTASRPRPEPARPPANRDARKGIRIAVTVLAVLLLVHGAVFVIVALAVTLMLRSRRNRRSGGQLPPLIPGAGGTTSQRPPPAASRSSLVP
jgi:hypothetical protein